MGYLSLYDSQLQQARNYTKNSYIVKKFSDTLYAMVTKRQLGIGLMTIGALAFIGTFAVDLLGAGNFSGVGPYQRLALIGAGLTFILGMTLLPLGDRSA